MRNRLTLIKQVLNCCHIVSLPGCFLEGNGVVGIFLIIKELELIMSSSLDSEHFFAANKAVIDAMSSAAQAVLAATENLVSLNFETARDALNDGTENLQALLSSKNPQEATMLQSALGKAAVEKAVAYSRGVYEVSTKAANDLGSLFQLQCEELTKVSQKIAQQAANASPFGADLAQAAVRQAAQLSDSYRAAVSSVLHTAAAKGKK